MRWCLPLFLAATMVAASAQEPLPPADLRGSRDLEVRVDELPDQLPLDQVEVVVASGAEACVRRTNSFLGVPLPVPIPVPQRFWCEHIQSYAPGHAGPLPLRLSGKTWQERRVGPAVAALDVELSRRYVLLSTWTADSPNITEYGVLRDSRWVVEEVLWDREGQRLLWHSLRGVYADDHFEGGKVWGMQIILKRHFAHVLPAALAQRGLVRNHAPVPGGRWVPASEVAGWTSAERGAIGILNTRGSPGRRVFGHGVALALRAQDQAPYQRQRIPLASAAWFESDLVPQAARTPKFDLYTHALLEVPPGRYLIDRWGEGEPPLAVDVQAGVLSVIEIQRALIGSDGPVLQDLAFWKTWLPRSRHAFLQEVRPARANVFPQTWFVGP